MISLPLRIGQFVGHQTWLEMLAFRRRNVGVRVDLAGRRGRRRQIHHIPVLWPHAVASISPSVPINLDVAPLENARPSAHEPQRRFFPGCPITALHDGSSGLYVAHRNGKYAA